jgi:hypothetical protein
MPSTSSYSIWGMSLVTSFPSMSIPNVSTLHCIVVSAHIHICIRWGKGLGFTIGSGFPPISGIPIGSPTIPNVGFPFGWNFNPGSGPSPSVFTSVGGSYVFGGTNVPGGSYMGGSVMSYPTNTPFAPATGHVPGNYFVNTNQGTPSQRDSCAFPSFGNVGAPLMAILNILGFSMWGC